MDQEVLSFTKCPGIERAENLRLEHIQESFRARAFRIPEDTLLRRRPRPVPANRLMEERNTDPPEELVTEIAGNGHPPQMADVNRDVHEAEASTPDPHDQFPILGPIPAPGFDEHMAMTIPHCIHHCSPEDEVAGVAHQTEPIEDPLAWQRTRIPYIVEQWVGLQEGPTGAVCIWLIERLFTRMGGARVLVDITRGEITMAWSPETFSPVAFARELQQFGYLLGPQRPDAAKNSPYECGFEAFEDARMKFDVRYYLVAILFILFDLEIAFLFPWAVALRDIGASGFWAMMIFLTILVVGFIYEWKKGALDWE